jgi:hypothetical protein
VLDGSRRGALALSQMPAWMRWADAPLLGSFWLMYHVPRKQLPVARGPHPVERAHKVVSTGPTPMFGIRCTRPRGLCHWHRALPWGVGLLGAWSSSRWWRGGRCGVERRCCKPSWKATRPTWRA